MESVLYWHAPIGTRAWVPVPWWPRQNPSTLMKEHSLNIFKQMVVSMVSKGAHPLNIESKVKTNVKNKKNEYLETHINCTSCFCL